MCIHINIIYICMSLFSIYLSSISLRSYKNVSENMKKQQSDSGILHFSILNFYFAFSILKCLSQELSRKVDESLKKRIINFSWRVKGSLPKGGDFLIQIFDYYLDISRWKAPFYPAKQQHEQQKSGLNMFPVFGTQEPRSEGS